MTVMPASAIASATAAAATTWPPRYVTATAIAQMPATGAVSRASWARSAAGKASLAVVAAVPSVSSAYRTPTASAAPVSHG